LDLAGELAAELVGELATAGLVVGAVASGAAEAGIFGRRKIIISSAPSG
jgi:hypothetical protein